MRHFNGRGFRLMRAEFSEQYGETLCGGYALRYINLTN